ncbi:HAD family phosphatase [Roseovarius sp. CAU 1744]|uniref:HAD family hydrolase n=1 Tax=Roseovarius sp. CAU 1744 TaxID=3140368 RepID=UPI00325AE603
MTQVQAVIFDIGNVLIEWQPERYFDRVIGPEKRRAFMAEVPFFAMMNRIDEGADFADQIEDTARSHPEWAQAIRLVRDRWCDLAQPAIPHSVRLAGALRERGVPVFILSNFGAGNFPTSQAQFPFLHGFDRYYISGRMKMRKPDPAIYAAVEADCRLPPETLLFADDRDENIAAAAARGWQTHLFTTPAGWADRLVAAGLLRREEAA